jgi:hypothetical protein
VDAVNGTGSWERCARRSIAFAAEAACHAIPV